MREVADGVLGGVDLLATTPAEAGIGLNSIIALWWRRVRAASIVNSNLGA
jgi:hypothetical protein